MADYYPLIAKALSGLDKTTGQARRELYERARKALVAQLRGVEPALSEVDITRERLALEEAIRKAEAEAARRSRNDPLPPLPQRPRSEANGLETVAPDPHPETGPLLTPGNQTSRPADAPATRVAAPLRPASLSTAADKPPLSCPSGEDGDEASGIAAAAPQGDARRAQGQRPRRERNGASISDEGLKGYRDVMGDGETPSDAPESGELARGRSPRSPASETVEARRQSRPAGRPAFEARPAPRAGAPGHKRTDPRIEPHASPPADFTDMPADIPSQTRVHERAAARRGEQGEPRGEPQRMRARVEPAGSSRPALPGELRGEPRRPPQRPITPPRRPPVRDSEQVEIPEPVVEPALDRHGRSGKRLGDLPPPPLLSEPSFDEPADEPQEAAWNEFPARPPSSMMRQENGRRVAGRSAANAKPDRQRRPARPLLMLPPQWKRTAAFVIAGLLLVTAAAAGLWKGAGLWPSFRGAPRTADTTLADNANRKATNRIDSGTTRLASASDSALVAQKVVLYEEDQNDPAGKRFIGSAVWRTDRMPPAPGKAPEIAVRADVEIPEQRLGLRWSLRRNDDKALPASHTVEIMLTLPQDFPHGSISNIPGVLMKQGESARGVPLAGLAVKVTNNFFLIGLSSVDSDMQRNIQLLKDRPWFDIPLVYGDGRRAIIAIEKGTPGERAFADAFADWGQ